MANYWKTGDGFWSAHSGPGDDTILTEIRRFADTEIVVTVDGAPVWGGDDEHSIADHAAYADLQEAEDDARGNIAAALKSVRELPCGRKSLNHEAINGAIADVRRAAEAVRCKKPSNVIERAMNHAADVAERAGDDFLRAFETTRVAPGAYRDLLVEAMRSFQKTNDIVSKEVDRVWRAKVEKAEPLPEPVKAEAA